MNYQTMNLGTKKNPQNMNLGIECTPTEREDFIKLFKQYKHVFAYTYDGLKTFDTNIMQHNISLKANVKPYQQKIRKMHPSLDKILLARIIFPINQT